MAKRVSPRPDWLKAPPHVQEIYSVSNCVSKDFADYISFWKHNGYWLFDSPEIIQEIAEENSISLAGTSLFYYEAHELEFDGEMWQPWKAEASFKTCVQIPISKQLEGFDIANFTGRSAPECSGLSCNALGETLETNSHCLFPSFEKAESALNVGAFNDSEPGPYRIFAVYSVDWP